MFLANSAYALPTRYNSVSDYDGQIQWTGAAYVRGTTATKIQVNSNGGTGHKGFVRFNTASIPNNATIIDVKFMYRQDTGAGGTSFGVYAMANEPSAATDANLWTDCSDGTLYASSIGAPIAGTWYTLDLGANGVTDVTASLATDWFAVGLANTATATTEKIMSVDSAGSEPRLIIEYHYKNIFYTFSEALNENNVALGQTTVTVIDSGGASEAVTVPVGGITIGFDELPSYISWNITASVYRRIYMISSTGTVNHFYPEAASSIYTPQIRDYTSTIQAGGCYLESYRTIGGTNQLVERALVTSTVNGVPLSLVNNRNYVLTINTPVTDYSFTFYTTTSTPSPILTMDTVNYTDVMQFNSRFIHVQASRPVFGSIQWDYDDDKGATTSVTVVAYYRNGTQAYNFTSVASSFTHTWAAANSTTDYIAKAIIVHSTLGNMTYSIPLDGEWTPPTAPTLSGLGTLGGVDMNQALGALMLLVVGGLVSAKSNIAGAFAVVLSALVLSYVGWMSISLGVIVLALVTVILFAIRGGNP